MNPLKILMLEDNESDAGLIQRALKLANVNFEYRLVDTRDEYVKGLDDFLPDAIFSDHSLPQFNSLEAFDILKNKKLNIPFILITGTVSEEFAVKCLKEGIDDYILKNNLSRLPSALENAISKRKLELDKHQLEMEHIEYIDKIKTQNLQLIKINHELDRFVYSASHELKAPLTSIIGLLYLIKVEMIEGNYEAVVEYLDLIKRSVNKLLTVIEEIIYYTANNRTLPDNELINIKDLIDTIWNKVKYLDDSQKIKPKTNIHQEVKWYSDKNRIMIILDNLLSNAIKFRDKEKNYTLVDIEVNILPEKVLLEIKDNGIGIHDKYLDKIFDMFFRASSLSDGSGLGLYLVKETIEKLNGKIKVESRIGKGTKFLLELPNEKPMIN